MERKKDCKGGEEKEEAERAVGEMIMIGTTNGSLYIQYGGIHQGGERRNVLTLRSSR